MLCELCNKFKVMISTRKINSPKLLFVFPACFMGQIFKTMEISSNFKHIRIHSLQTLTQVCVPTQLSVHAQNQSISCPPSMFLVKKPPFLNTVIVISRDPFHLRAILL